ncbi:MAG: fructosamine kinase family protein [Thiobacillus sp.]|nr:fructosamine kinase family protein [Thiobacillus sp.]
MRALFETLAAEIGRASGAPFAVKTSRAAHGGDISQAFTLSDGARRFFAKLQPAARLALFEAEAAGLAELAAAEAVRVPRVICFGEADGHVYLVLEHLDLQPRGDAAQLGHGLARQHRVEAAQFGGPCDNYIGATPQPNCWHARWTDFWREHRLGFQLRLAAGNGYGGRLQHLGEQLLAGLDAFFEGYSPRPSLLHGDLWGGNHGFLADGAPVIFDPAVYYGDRECDLAMSELFGGFAPAFHDAYREAWPLDAGYAVRRTLYNLYHVLNHANLFGGGYPAQAARMIEQLLSHTR